MTDIAGDAIVNAYTAAEKWRQGGAKAGMNIYDIATAAGVSSATVSRVVNGNKSVKEETRKKILKIIEENNYVPNSFARSLRSGEPDNIAFVVPDIENPFFGKLLHGLSDTANKYGYNVFMYGTNEDISLEHRILAGIKKEMVRGVVITPVSDEDSDTADRLNKMEDNQIPVVLLDRDITSCAFDGVFSSDYENSYEAVNCLINAGHRKIGAVIGRLDSRPGRERFRGYKKALKDAGIELRDDYITNGNFKVKEAYEGMERLMNLEDKPTAVFSMNNMSTLGCLTYMKEHGMKLGRDISMIGFDEIEELKCTDISLTVVDRPIYEMGSAALELLEFKFNSDQNSEKSRIMRRINMLKGELIIRGSERIKK